MPVKEIGYLIGRSDFFNCVGVAREGEPDFMTGEKKGEFLIIPSFNELDHDLITRSGGTDRSDNGFHAKLKVCNFTHSPVLEIDGFHGVEGDCVQLALLDGEYDSIFEGYPSVSCKDIVYACKVANWAISVLMKTGKTTFLRKNADPRFIEEPKIRPLTNCDKQYEYEFVDRTVCITHFTGNGIVKIPNQINGFSVTRIKGFEGAFRNLLLTSVTIPSNVIDIGNQAFFHCSVLTTILVDDLNSVYSSVDGVLFNKTRTILLECPRGKAGDYSIPSSITTIKSKVFSGCDRLISVTIPSSVTSIDHSSFSGCDNLTEISVDELNPVYSSVDGVLFDKSRSTLLEFPRGKAGGYSVPCGVATIRNFAFVNCTRLLSVTVPNSVTSVGDSAFWCCAALTIIEADPLSSKNSRDQ